MNGLELVGPGCWLGRCSVLAIRVQSWMLLFRVRHSDFSNPTRRQNLRHTFAAERSDRRPHVHLVPVGELSGRLSVAVGALTILSALGPRRSASALWRLTGSTRSDFVRSRLHRTLSRPVYDGVGPISSGGQLARHEQADQTRHPSHSDRRLRALRQIQRRKLFMRRLGASHTQVPTIR
jgi:hypothetical protein